MGKRKVIETCPKCGHTYTLGYNGTGEGCDTCTGVKRDRNGYAWEPGETQMELRNVATGSVSIVTRADALGVGQ
jgi:hypothetical protein